MTSVPDEIITWQIRKPPYRKLDTGETNPGRFELVKIPVPKLKPGEVLVEIAGCGVCYEDLFLFHEAGDALSPSSQAFGREISGKVIAGEASWIEKEVIIPSILPCGKCVACMDGKTDRCLHPIAPGNHLGICGGFASHIPVLCHDLCVINTRRSLPIDHLAVISNAVSTAFHATKQAVLEPGDIAIVIGIGGIGQYCVQIAKLLGAATVIAADIVERRIQPMHQFGADAVISTSRKSPHAAADEISYAASKGGLPKDKWKIIETAGTLESRETAMSLLKIRGDKVVFIQPGIPETEYVGRNADGPEEKIIYSRGCPPEYYPDVLDWVVTRKIVITPFIQTRPMSWIHEVFEEGDKRLSEKRTVLTTDDFGLYDPQECKSCR